MEKCGRKIYTFIKKVPYKEISNDLFILYSLSLKRVKVFLVKKRKRLVIVWILYMPNFLWRPLELQYFIDLCEGDGTLIVIAAQRKSSFYRGTVVHKESVGVR